MSYITYVACNRCGDTILLSTNATFCLSKAVKALRSKGWKVRNTRDGVMEWLCTACKEQEAEKK